MNDKPTIMLGLAIFLALATFPIWYTLGFSDNPSPPDLATPEGAFAFDAPWSAVGGDLEGGMVGQGLREEFEQHQISLSDNVILGRGNRDGQWKIVDGENRYLLAKRQDRARIYNGCVQENMGASHMQLLIGWRESVVREGNTEQVEVNGTKYRKSLTRTCLACHNDRQEFCYKCHDYANVLPARLRRESGTTAQGEIRCWNCHVDPKKEVTDG